MLGILGPNRVAIKGSCRRLQGRALLRTALAVLLLAGAFTNLGHAAQSLYVAPNGHDANPGTLTQPFRQIRQAVSLLQPGDSVLVADGDYLGFDIRDKVGQPGTPITIRAQGTNAVATVTTDRSDNRDTIHLADCAYVVVDGLRSFGANRAALRVEGGHHITIRNCVFGNNTTWGLFTGFSDDLLIENNECYGSQTQHGIYVSNSGDRPVLRGNRCYDNAGGGIQLNADVNIQPGDGIITGALLESNIIYNNGRSGGGAFNLDGVQDSIVRNNLLFNNHASGIIFFQIDGAEGPRGNEVYFNTVDMPADGRWALNFLQTTGKNIARNNNLLTHHTFRGSLRFGEAADVANTDSDYNILTKITPDDDAVLLLSDWQAQGHELHSLSAAYATVFVNDAAANYRLKSGSPAINAAQSNPSTLFDLEGMVRPFGNAPDLGCYESSNLALLIEPVAAAGYRVKLRGGAGRLYQIERSTTLSDWAPVASFTAGSQPMEVIEPKAVGKSIIFRASSAP